MTNKKWYRIDFYLALMEPDEFTYERDIRQAVSLCVDLIGDCTIIPCIGSCMHYTGLRVQMNAFQIIKFIDDKPEEFAYAVAEKLKKEFKQNCVIVNISECQSLRFI